MVMAISRALCKTIVNNRAVTAWTFSNVIAGSDSTAVVMRTVWYNLLAHPETLHRLRDELTETAASRPGGFSKPFPAWKDVCDLPYLDACINEGVRLHPPFCLPFERVVPSGGITIGGYYFPEGTVVGMSPYVVNRHAATFGPDADEWRPGRWMVPEGERRKLEASILTVSRRASIPFTYAANMIDCVVWGWQARMPGKAYCAAGIEKARFNPGSEI